MSKANWSLNQLKSRLSESPGIRGWVIQEEDVHRRERYFMLDGKALVADQDRNVRQQTVELSLFVDIGKPGRQGEITKRIFKALPLETQLQDAIVAARQTDHQAWDLPAQIPGKVPALRTGDQRMAEDLERVMQELTEKIEKAVGKTRSTRFNSAELFLSVHDRTLHLSNGLTHRGSQTRIYAETAYSYARNGSSDEYLNARWAVSLDDLNIESLFDETSDRAERSLDVEKPLSGKYPVIIDAEVLATLFNGHVSQLTAKNSYQGLPFVKKGEPLIPSASGDLLTITLDPHLEYGADSTAISVDGTLQEPVRLVEKNQVIATAADKRHADYLKLPMTSARGNVVVELGSASHAELTRMGPRVIEILQFSGLFADPNSGTFSSEIRLAKLYDNEKGTVRYLKGGSLSGSITENFRGARFSNRRVKHSHFSANELRGSGYCGPDFALLSEVSIVG